MQWPPCRSLDDALSRYEVEEAMRALANRMTVGPNGLPAEPLKVLAEKGGLDTLGRFHDIIVAEVASRNNGKVQRLRRCTRRKIGQSVATIVASSSWLTQANYSSKSSRVAFVTTANTRNFSGGTLWVQIPTLDG